MMIAVAEPFNWNNAFLFGIAALAAWNAFRSSQRDKAQKEVKETTKKVEEKVDQIGVAAGQLHELTNGNLSRTVAALEKANETIKGQQAVIATHVEAKRVADAVAERAADKVAPTPITPTEVIVMNTPENRVPVADEKTKPK